MNNNYYYDQITEELQDFHRIARNYDALPPPIPQLQSVWQWDQTGTGLPHFERDDSMYSRYVPPFFTEDSIPKNLVDIVPEFVKGMRSNDDTFFIRTTGVVSDNWKINFLRRLQFCDLKKLNISAEYGRLTFRKTMHDLLPYSEEFEEVPLRISQENGVRKSANELITEMNEDAQHGWYGPGTQWCRHPLCQISGPCVSRTPILLWGPRESQVLHLRKRFTCGANNVVYCLHCDQCLTENRWTTYIGQSERQDGNFHTRLGSHSTDLVNPWNRRRFDGQDVEQLVHGMMHNGDPDPHNLRQDPYSHWCTCHHSRTDRKITVIDGGFPSLTSRLNHETFYQRHIGGWDYYEQSGTGSLNPFS